MKTAFVATLAAWIAVAALAAVAAGLAGALSGWLAPYTSFRFFAGGAALGGVAALACGALGLWLTRGGERAGRPQAWFAVVVGLLLVAVVLVKVLPMRSAPPIHDLTTDLDDPPSFRVAARHPENVGRDMAYPHGGATVPARQRDAYPDLASIRVATTPEAAFDAALATAQDLGWTVSWSNAELLLIEATEASGFFGFVDDVVIRVRPAGAGNPAAGGSIVDLRSTSRVGVSDLGVNAQRIAAFGQRYRERIKGGADEPVLGES